MLGTKQRRIKALTEDVAYWREEADRARAQRNDAYKEREEARESAKSLEEEMIAADGELVRERSVNQALADENRDLVRQLELLRAVFKQLNIAIKLPGKRG